MNNTVLEWIGRFLARIHTRSATPAIQHRPALDLQVAMRHGMFCSRNYLPLDGDTLAKSLQGRHADYHQAVLKTPAQSRRTIKFCACTVEAVTPTRHSVDARGLPVQGPRAVRSGRRDQDTVQDLWILLMSTTQCTRQLGGRRRYEEFRG
jgi:hypothetical protein